ncbi:DUF4236 domain-containing protein [Mesorhizobium sp. M1076]
MSNSGIGASVGIRGLRIGSGPRGNYIHAGLGGFYYRGSLPSGRTQPSRSSVDRLPSPSAIPDLPTPRTSDDVTMREISSGSVLEMVPESAAELLSQINEMNQRTKLSTVVLFLGFAAIFLSFISGSGGFTAFVVGVIIVVFCAARYADGIRRAVVLVYEFDPEVLYRYRAFVEAFERISSAKAIWHVTAQGNVTNRKRHAGAGTLINRKGLTISIASPAVVKTNISVPTVPVGSQTLHFFPDRVLVVNGKKVGAIEYEDLRLDVNTTNFIEEDLVPSDARVVRYSWRYPNRDGGPDRRFKDNRQIPVCAYQEAHFTSSSGLNELIQVSTEGLLAQFAKELQNMAFPPTPGNAEKLFLYIPG